MSDLQQATHKLEQWISQQLRKGVSKQQLFYYLLKRGFSESAVSALLDGYSPPVPGAIIEQLPENISQQAEIFDSGGYFYALSKLPFTQKSQRFQLSCEEMQLFVLPDVVETKLCEQLIIRSKRHFSPSKVVGKAYAQKDSGRTSDTALVRDIALDIEQKLKQHLSQTLGIHPAYCEPLQIQRYEPGQAYQNHADWFDKAHPGYQQNMKDQGQRTWTCLLYLNDNFEGGHTYFSQAEKTVSPKAGAACIWNNLLPSGEVNDQAYHEGRPVTKGEKFILTAWFRARPYL